MVRTAQEYMLLRASVQQREGVYVSWEPPAHTLKPSALGHLLQQLVSGIPSQAPPFKSFYHILKSGNKIPTTNHPRPSSQIPYSLYPKSGLDAIPCG